MTSIAVPVGRAALFLDLDGTLARIEPRPNDVKPDGYRSAVVKWAADALEGRIAVISGRTIEEVDRILEGRAKCVAGVHGLERRGAAGVLETPPPHPALNEAREVFGALARACSGLMVEEKSLSLALHYRGAPSAKEAVHELAERLAQSTGLVLQEGRMVAELKTPGANKGQALLAFMQEQPFQGAVPIFIGDDVTDEPAFKAAADSAGIGVLVGPARKTSASLRLDSPADVLSWIIYSLETGAFRLEATP